MGTQSAAALTDIWGSPAPAGLLYVGIDVGRRQHLAAGVPESRMWDGSWERVQCAPSLPPGPAFAI